MIASVFLAFFNNLTFLFGTCYPGNTTDDMFVSSIFDSIKVVKTHSLTLGMQNLFVLIVFIFVMHDYLSREILNQGVYALVRMHRRTKWLVRRMAGLAVICAVYMGIYLTIVYELSSYYVHKRLVIPHSAVLPKAWLALFMMVYFAAVFTVVSDIRIGRSASCIVGAVVLAALIMIGMYEPYRKYKDAMWMLALNPACAMFVYTTAGKIGFMKMLLRLLAGLIHPDDGEVHYGGKKVKKLTQVVNIGLSIENIGLYDDMTVYQNMKYYAKLSGGCDKRKIEETLQRMGLTDRKNMRFAKLSLA